MEPCSVAGAVLPKRNLREVVAHARVSTGQPHVMEYVMDVISSVDDGA